MLDLLSGFVVELRNAGLPVSLTENLDAMEGAEWLGSQALGCTRDTGGAAPSVPLEAVCACTRLFP